MWTLVALSGLWTIALAWMPGFCRAQSDWKADALVQRLPSGEAYLETQIEWLSQSTTLQEPLTVTVLVLKGDVVVGFQKDDILARPVVQDSADLQHVHVRRIAVPSGPLKVEWSVGFQDSTIWLHNVDVRIPIGGSPEFTDPMLVQTHAPASERSHPDMVHSGLDLIPSVGKKIPQNVKRATFYVELHGLSEVVGTDSLFLLAYGWADPNGDWNPKATKYERKRASQVVPIFESLPCTPSSPTPERAVLKLEARTRDGHVVVSRDVDFGPRYSSEDWANQRLHRSVPLESLQAWDDLDAMKRHLEDHLPVATSNEQSTIQNTLLPHGSAEEMKQYLTGFWLERSSSMAEADARHTQYAQRIAYVDEMYGDCKYGQGSLTEMGNIYLRFGKPNTVVQRHHETEYYPYEIWHYHKAGRFTNKRFLFYAPHVVGECFEMLHSDMLGERQNEDWLSQLKSRENRLRVSESMENRLNPRDAFSREEPEDLFYNPR